MTSNIFVLGKSQKFNDLCRCLISFFSTSGVISVKTGQYPINVSIQLKCVIVLCLTIVSWYYEFPLINVLKLIVFFKVSFCFLVELLHYWHIRLKECVVKNC